MSKRARRATASAGRFCLRPLGLLLLAILLGDGASAVCQAPLDLNCSVLCQSDCCPGDCNRDGEVTISELLIGLNLALNTNPPPVPCFAFDNARGGAVGIDELTSAIGAALDGCRLPTPTFDCGLEFQLSVDPENGTADYVTLELLGRTVEYFPCAGYRIFAGIQVADQLISVSLGCIAHLSPVCLTVILPATFSTTLVVAPGDYELHFHAAESTDRYAARVTADDVEVEVIEASFSEHIRSELADGSE